jgi:hypothetical protein
LDLSLVIIVFFPSGCVSPPAVRAISWISCRTFTSDDTRLRQDLYSTWVIPLLQFTRHLKALRKSILF